MIVIIDVNIYGKCLYQRVSRGISMETSILFPKFWYYCEPEKLALEYEETTKSTIQ